MANRDRHRQGLVYGPVRPTGPRDRGRIVGTLLGLLVLGASAVLLLVGVYVVLQAGGPRPSAGPATLAPRPSSSANANFVATASPVASGLPASLVPVGSMPPPTLYVPPVVAGPGFITFGSNVDGQLQVTDAKTIFGLDEPMVWSANLTEPADSADLKIRIYKLDAKQPSGERLMRTDEVKPDAFGAHLYFRRLRPLGVTLGAGLFTIEYVRGETVLATGSFLIQ